MKGFASETIIVSGTFLLGSRPVLGGILMCLGSLSALISFSIEFGRDQKKEKLLDAVEKILTALSETTQKVDLSVFKQNSNFH